MPHSEALNSSSQPSSPRDTAQVATPGRPRVLPSEEGETQPNQVEPELHPPLLRLLSPALYNVWTRRRWEMRPTLPSWHQALSRSGSARLSAPV